MNVYLRRSLPWVLFVVGLFVGVVGGGITGFAIAFKDPNPGNLAPHERVFVDLIVLPWALLAAAFHTFVFALVGGLLGGFGGWFGGRRLARRGTPT